MDHKPVISQILLKLKAYTQGQDNRIQHGGPTQTCC